MRWLAEHSGEQNDAPHTLGSITVNCVLSGAIEADMVAALPDDIVQAVVDTIPMRALGMPEGVAEAVRYLVSDETHYVTGALPPVTGGLLMM